MNNHSIAVNKLPEVTLFFWIMKIAATTMGDVLTKSYEKGGLNFGTIGSSIVLGTISGRTPNHKSTQGCYRRSNGDGIEL
jgi:uncharacterized membrane-anchored protein